VDQCPICLQNLEDEIRETTCGCRIHIDCFNQLLKNACNSQIYPILCPWLRCKKEQDLTVLAELLSKTEFEPLLDLAFFYYTLTTKDIVRCPRNCGYLLSWDKKSKCNEFQCPNCDIDWCVKCLQEAHEGACQEIPDSFKRCKMCNAMIERSVGCANVTCRCGYQFCWICMSPKGCKCSPGHGYYAVGKVLSNWDAHSQYYVCNCTGFICTCKEKVKK